MATPRLLALAPGGFSAPSSAPWRFWAAGFVASWFPARRASRLDPLEALRHEERVHCTRADRRIRGRPPG